MQAQHAKVMASAFSGMRFIGDKNIRKRLDRIPKAFSTTLRARLSL